MDFINKREAKKAEKQAELNKVTFKDYIEQNEAFLTKNKDKAGVTITASGLQYEVIKMGTGPKPTAQSTVKVHYVGTLIDGTEFDSSIKRNQPAQFPVSGVIPGWTEALQLMPVGSKFKLYIPQSIAYGAKGAGEKIKPYSTLIFEVELLEIVK
jgi:FKBP-type peptidyl-prolyl cis-trans isomerase FklB